MTTRERVYARLPPPLQHAAVSAYGYSWRRRRRGGCFRAYVAEFAAREWLTAESWDEWQEIRLRKILGRALQTPFYSSAWASLGMDDEAVERFALRDLARLPTVSKDDVRKHPQRFCMAGTPPKGALAWPTSGSTGTPLITYHSSDDLRRGLALREARYSSFAGVDHSMPRATFGGRIVEPDPDSRGPFHRYNIAERQLYFSAYHLSATTLGAYADALRQHQSRWLTGYSSTIYELSRLALAEGVQLPPVLAVITTAEPVPDHFRVCISQAFGCRVTQEYGLAEEVCFALECERGSLHVSPDAGVVEILDTQGYPCPPGVVGEIVATGLIREAQPLVRYRTGDLACWATGNCGCGRSMPVLARIEGRVDDAVVTSDGRRVSRLTAVARGLSDIRYMQFVQERAGRLTVIVVTDQHPLAEAVREEIVRRLVARLGTGMEIDVMQADEPERTARGKIRAVINRAAEEDA